MLAPAAHITFVEQCAKVFIVHHQCTIELFKVVVDTFHYINSQEHNLVKHLLIANYASALNC